MKILLTGTTGFIGGALQDELLLRNNIIIAAVRNVSADLTDNVTQVKINDDFALESSELLDEVDTIIHCAARAHILRDKDSDPLTEFRKANTTGTLNLARQAVAAGVKRFLFISSIGVTGNSNTQPFTELDMPAPQEAYAISKYEAELALCELSKQTGLEVVIIRPPLVYGPNAPGNFASLMYWIHKNIPLPFNAIHNKRSFVGLFNLVDFIITCSKHPAAANEIFLVSDGEDLSTTDLLKRVSRGLGKEPRLFSVNQKFLEFCLFLAGKKHLAQRLCGSLQVDISKAKNLLNWTPPVSVNDELKKTAESFLKTHT